jgi:hypothetical protein
VIGLLPLPASLLLAITPRCQEKYLQTRPKLASGLHGDAWRGGIYYATAHTHRGDGSASCSLAEREREGGSMDVDCWKYQPGCKNLDTIQDGVVKPELEYVGVIGEARQVGFWLRAPLEVFDTVITYLLSSGHIGNAVELVGTLLRAYEYAVASYFGKIQPLIPGSYEEYCIAIPNSRRSSILWSSPT